MTSETTSAQIFLGNKQTVILHYFASLQSLEHIWRTLESDCDFVFQTFDWIATWHECLGQTFKLCPVLLTTDQHVPLAILPLGVQQSGSIRQLTWLGGDLADYHAPLMSTAALQQFSQLDKSALQELWQTICSQLPTHDCVLLEKQPVSIAGLPKPFIFDGSFAHSCSAHSTEISGSVDNFIASKQSAAWLKKERRSERRLQEAGEIRFVLAASANEIEHMLNVLFHQKSRSYQELGAIDLFADSNQRQFVTAYTHKNASLHRSLLCGLYVGDILTATAWCAIHAKRCYFLLPTYEKNALARYSPGNLLLRHLFDWCLRNQITRFDFTAGDEPYKQAWCNLTLELRDYLAGVTLYGRVYVFTEKLRRRIKSRIKQSPWLFRMAKKIRAATS